ncbi:MAG TPA: tripartite tricarboxylate transporter TctB family protein [Oligella sp.]|jgi:putative tricarboxylic transport membrane protein|nr:tripartite tricarboxylate transporter TctB family protein [Oligella sp.]
MKLTDRTLGIVAILFAVFLGVFGYDLEPPFSYEPIGPKAFPLLIAVIMAICGLILTVKGGNEAEANTKSANLRILTMVAYIVLYAFLFNILGFVVSTALMTIFVGKLFGAKWWQAIVGGVVMSVLFFLLFDRTLDVVLPQGILGGVL